MSGRVNFLAFVVLLAGSAASAQVASAPTSTSTASTSATRTARLISEIQLQQQIDIIQEAKDAGTALSAYAKGQVIDGRNVELNRAYTRRMLQLGLPLRVQASALIMTQVDPTDPLGWAVSGYCSARSGDYAAAVNALVKATALDGKDPSTRKNLGQLLAWYDAQKSKPSISGTTQRIIELARDDWMKADEFSKGFGKASAVLEKQAATQKEFDTKLGDAQADLDSKQQSLKELGAQYERYTREVAQHKKNIHYLNAVGEDETPDWQAIEVEETAMKKAQALADEALKNGEVAAAAVKSRRAILAQIKEQQPQLRVADAFLLDPPAVGGVVTPEAAGPATTTPSSLATADPESEAARRLTLGNLYLANKMNAQAASVLDELIAKYPTSKVAAEARRLRECMSKD